MECGGLSFKHAQVRVLAEEIVVHLAVGGAEAVDVGLALRRAGELHVGPRAVRGHVEAVALQEGVGLHAPVLVRRAHHRVSEPWAALLPHPSRYLDF